MTLIVDASVYNKLFLDEPDTPIVLNLFKNLLESRANWFAPDHLRLEMCLTALHYQLSFDIPLSLLAEHEKIGLVISPLSTAVWKKAETISRHGHQKSGYPSLNDSLYHALAIEMDATFVTADHRHFAKAEGFGHIALLGALDLNMI